QGTLRTDGPGSMPTLLALVMLGAGVLIVTLGRDTTPLAAVRWQEWRHTLAILAACAFVALALERLGYRFRMALACAFLLGVVERKGPVATVLFAVGMAAGTYYLFDTLLRVQLARGAFG